MPEHALKEELTKRPHKNKADAKINGENVTLTYSELSKNDTIVTTIIDGKLKNGEIEISHVKVTAGNDVKEWDPRTLPPEDVRSTHKTIKVKMSSDNKTIDAADFRKRVKGELILI